MQIVAITDYEQVPQGLYKRCDDCRQLSPKRWKCTINDSGILMTFWFCEECRERHRIPKRANKRKNPLAFR